MTPEKREQTRDLLVQDLKHYRHPKERNLLRTLESRFTSGNDVPVTRAMITREEYERLHNIVSRLLRDLEAARRERDGAYEQFRKIGYELARTSVAYGPEWVDAKLDEIRAQPTPQAGETPKEVTKSGIPLTWTSNWRGGKAHIEWHAPCGCAWHPKPKPHWHPCEAHSPKHELSAKRDKLAEAANNMDWQQVALNGGPPCFHLEEDGRFCGRAERWAGHGDVHAYLSLAGLLERELSAKREGFVTVPRDVIAQGRTPPENSPDDHFRAGWRAAFMYLEDRIAAATREAQ